MLIIHAKSPRYRAYVLRCWEMQSQHHDRPATWRFSLEDPQTRHKHTFLDLKSLVAFLEAQINDGSNGENGIYTMSQGEIK